MPMFRHRKVKGQGPRVALGNRSLWTLARCFSVYGSLEADEEEVHQPEGNWRPNSEQDRWFFQLVCLK